jgi:hypothetical protein
MSRLDVALLALITLAACSPPRRSRREMAHDIVARMEQLSEVANRALTGPPEWPRTFAWHALFRVT